MAAELTPYNIVINFISGIANTMDLPEKLLPRISSCMGIQRLCFGPYQQLQEIISTRLKGIDAFEKQAIEFASRKVGLSATSSSIVDCNSLLYICWNGWIGGHNLKS